MLCGVESVSSLPLGHHTFSSYLLDLIFLGLGQGQGFGEGRRAHVLQFPPDHDEAGHQGTIIWSVLSCWLLGSSADMLGLLGMVGMIFLAEFSVA